jgi:hypothetical protein
MLQLVVFDGARFDVEFEISYEKGYFTTVNFGGGTAFLPVTYYKNPEGTEAALFEKIEGKWKEVLKTGEYNNFYAVQPVSYGTCWLIGDSGERYDEVLKYERGRLKHFGIEVSSGGFSAYSRESRTFYYFPTREGFLLVTDNGGNTWREEAVKVPGHYRLNRISHITGAPNALFLLAGVFVEDLEYQAILKRTGPAGEGNYELSYLGWVGPGVIRIDECAFRDADHGMAVGLGASLFYDAPCWFREPLEPFSRLEGLAPDPLGGYWALYRDTIVWHP